MDVDEIITADDELQARRMFFDKYRYDIDAHVYDIEEVEWE